jgi:hypothetical protein
VRGDVSHSLGGGALSSSSCMSWLSDLGSLNVALMLIILFSLLLGAEQSGPLVAKVARGAFGEFYLSS